MAARQDVLFVALAALHAAALVAFASAPLMAIALWWNANTIAHNFIHRPFFRRRLANQLFSAGESVLLGLPQSLWRQRHLAHHAGGSWRFRLAPQVLIEGTLVAALWASLAIVAPEFFFSVYMPGYLAGLGLCAVQGYYEHAAGTTSYYGWLYNVLCFNDGYHIEHHAYPGVHWTALPRRTASNARASRWPPLLRWLDAITLDALERLVLRSTLLQRFVLAVHRRAFRSLLAELPLPRRVAIVGGGLFPRTALLLRELLPDAALVVIDADANNLDTARAFIGDGVEFRNAYFSTNAPALPVDLLIIPLAFDGDRDAIYREPHAPVALVHDWLWRPRGRSRIVSIALLKRLNAVRGQTHARLAEPASRIA